MNYRHAYHAGNFADVCKHIALLLVLRHLRLKDTPFFVLDTHAGIGSYDLQSAAARKTGEAVDGIARLWDRGGGTKAVQDYLDLVRGFNRKGGLRIYPGSPLIAQKLLRAEDRLIANELHPEDVLTLRHQLGPDQRVRVEHMDAYRTLKAFLPPPERRGLVLIDPPFEVTDEFERILQGLREAARRWATGIYMIWYPVKDDGAVKFEAGLRELPFDHAKTVVIRQRAPDPDASLPECGLAILNAPWQLEANFQAAQKFI